MTLNLYIRHTYMYCHPDLSKIIKSIFDVLKFLETTVIVYLILKIKFQSHMFQCAWQFYAIYAKFCIIFKTAEIATSCAVIHGFNVVYIFRWNFPICNKVKNKIY